MRDINAHFRCGIRQSSKKRKHQDNISQRKAFSDHELEITTKGPSIQPDCSTRVQCHETTCDRLYDATLSSLENLSDDCHETNLTSNVSMTKCGHGTNLTLMQKLNKYDVQQNPSEELSTKNYVDSMNIPSDVWQSALAESQLIETCHIGLVSNVIIFAVTQMKLCGLTVDDRIGKYKNREIGYPGICCIHCGGEPGFGRYFPGSFDSFLNGKNMTSIVQHVKECRCCPDDIRNTLKELSEQDQYIQNRPAHGSRRQFFELLWRKISSYKVHVDDDHTGGKPGSSLQKKLSEPKRKPPLTIATCKRTTEMFTDEAWNLLIGGSELVSVEDRYLVEDILVIAFSQLKRCFPDQADRLGRKGKEYQDGFVGICCKHCRGQSESARCGRYFPSSLRSLAQSDTCLSIVRHITTTCNFCPDYIRIAAQKAINLEISHEKKYGTRILFYRRVWRRLHQRELVDMEVTKLATQTTLNQKALPEDNNFVQFFPWHRIIGDSKLVSLADLNLIPASELAAIAQMIPCKLTTEEQVGWFKDRPVGWGGLACKHCQGRPSHGKYFPKSFRTLAQTTCGQTIVSHVAFFCETVPKDIGNVVRSLQNIESLDRSASTASVRDHGARKVFYCRLWKALHTQDSLMPKDIMCAHRNVATFEHASCDCQSRNVTHKQQLLNIDDTITIAVRPTSSNGSTKPNEKSVLATNAMIKTNGTKKISKHGEYAYDMNSLELIQPPVRISRVYCGQCNEEFGHTLQTVGSDQNPELNELVCPALMESSNTTGSRKWKKLKTRNDKKIQEFPTLQQHQQSRLHYSRDSSTSSNEATKNNRVNILTKLSTVQRTPLQAFYLEMLSSIALTYGQYASTTNTSRAVID